MGYPLRLSLRYLGSKKRDSIAVGTVFAVLGVALGVAALLTVMSVTGGFQAEFREKVLGVNAHVLVLKHSPEFRNYRDIMENVRGVPGVVNVAPFSINPMMLSHGDKTATGVLVKGVDPQASLGVGLPDGVPPVLDLPRHVVRGEAGECPKPTEMACGIRMLAGLRREGAAPPAPKHEPVPLAPKPIPTDIEPMPSGSASPSAPPPDGSADPGGSASPPSGSAAPLPSATPLSGPPPASASASPPPPTGSGYAPDIIREGMKSYEKDAKRDDAGDEPDADEDVPQGAVTPDGGYKSQLPEDDDEVLAELVKDPCDDPEEVKKLPGVVVGTSLAETLDLELGTCVTISSPTIGFQFSGGAVKAPVAKSFRVMAMFEAGFDQYDSKLVYTDLYEAQEFYDEGDTVTGVEMKIADIDRSDDVVCSVKEVLGCSCDRPVVAVTNSLKWWQIVLPICWLAIAVAGIIALVRRPLDGFETAERTFRRRLIGGAAIAVAVIGCVATFAFPSPEAELNPLPTAACAYRVMDWKELNHGLFTALLIQQVGMSAVLALIILVAAFTVVATLIMVVLDKKKEISVLKAMGATDSAILRVFLYQGGIIGGLGTSLGLLIGYGVCKVLLVWAFPLDPKVYFISQLPVLMRWQEFVITGAVALVLCLLATVIPSLYAANIRPAEGFREQ